MFPIPSNAQAKIEDVSRVLLNHVSQMPGKMSTSLLQQVSTGPASQPFADISKKLAVRNTRKKSDRPFLRLILFICYLRFNSYSTHAVNCIVVPNICAMMK